jgi:hypothetical protein
VHLTVFCLNEYNAALPTELGMKAPIVIPTYSRHYYLEEVLNGLSKNPGFEDHPVIVSQDGSFDGVYNVCEWYSTRYSNVKHIQHYREPLHHLGFIHRCFPEAAASKHFYHLLNTAFTVYKDCHSVIVLEEDIWPSLDFLNYAEWAEQNIIKKNNRIGYVLCQPSVITDVPVSENLYTMNERISFVPRGWIVSRIVWEKVLRDSWTMFGNYDIHLLNRVMPYFPYTTAEPVISRTIHIGVHGINYKGSNDLKDLDITVPNSTMTDIQHPANWKNDYAKIRSI